ncbi:hypothetical protein C0995_013653 [Termitomyces sp. Mi166|nr:hypothetical protein C0995_013653 [Termitomyces sp. Mi166\
MDAPTKKARKMPHSAADPLNRYTISGIHLVVFLAALFTIWTGFKHQRQFRLAMTIVMTLLFILTTADLAVYWAYVHHAFITHGDSPESIVAALDEYPTWFLATNVFEAVNVFLADCISIWRTFVVWERKWKVVILPIAFTIVTLAFWSLMLVSPIFCTTSIVYRLVKAGGLRSYAKIIEILVESAALYCFATLFALTTYPVPGSPFEYAFAFWKTSTGIAPTLIVARMALGKSGIRQRSWVTETDREEQLFSGSISSTEIRVHTETRTCIDQDCSHDFAKAVADRVFELK